MSKADAIRAWAKEVLDWFGPLRDGQTGIRLTSASAVEYMREDLEKILAATPWHKWPGEEPPHPGWYLVRVPVAEGLRPYDVAFWMGRDKDNLPMLNEGPGAGWSPLVTHWRELPDPPEASDAR